LEAGLEDDQVDKINNIQELPKEPVSIEKQDVIKEPIQDQPEPNQVDFQKDVEPLEAGLVNLQQEELFASEVNLWTIQRSY
jgi:hypothetical protein